MENKNYYCVGCEEWIDRVQADNYHQSHHIERWLSDAEQLDLQRQQDRANAEQLTATILTVTGQADRRR